jgi:hypothetical protein
MAFPTQTNSFEVAPLPLIPAPLKRITPHVLPAFVAIVGPSLPGGFESIADRPFGQGYREPLLPLRRDDCEILAIELDVVSWLLPDWLGRYLGLIGPPEPGA